jgi:hypothetical protein
MSQLIKLEEFTTEQLPELKGKKEEVQKKLQEFPLVAEIVDTKSYEEAKKSRTGVKTLRTGLQKESKMVLSKIKEHVLNKVSKAYDDITNEVIEEEKKRQDPIDVYEAELERKRQEKAEQERLRIEAIKNSIDDWYASWIDRVSMLTYNKIQEVEEYIAESIANFDVSALEEFDVLFEDKVDLLKTAFKSKSDELKKEQEIIENKRVLEIKTTISNWYEKKSNIIDGTNDLGVLEKDFLLFIDEEGIPCAEFQPEFAEKRANLVSRFENKIMAIKTELKQKAEQEEIRLKNERILDKQKELRIKEVGELHTYFNNFEFIREMDDLEYEDELLKAKQNKQEADELEAKEKERQVKELEIERAVTLEPYKEFLPKDYSLNLGTISQEHFDHLYTEVLGKKEYKEHQEAKKRQSDACEFMVENGFTEAKDQEKTVFYLHEEGREFSKETLVSFYEKPKLYFSTDESLEDFKQKVLLDVETKNQRAIKNTIMEVDFEDINDIEVIGETQVEEGFVKVPYSIFKAFPCDSTLGAEARKLYFQQIQK